MAQDQEEPEAFFWMPHKQDYEMCCCVFGAEDDTEIPRNVQEQLVITAGP